MAVTTTLKVLREAVADQLGLLVNTTLSAAADPNFTAATLADKTPDAEKMRDSFLYQSVGWSRITTFGYPSTNIVTVARAGSGLANGVAQVYFMLDPDEFNAAINEAIQQLYFVEREAITLVANTYTYALPSWIQQKGQILSVKWRDITLLTTNPVEEEVNAWRVFEDNNACTLLIHDLLRSVTTYDIQVSGRRNYSSLASDSATTTCPYPLLFAACTVKVLHKIFNKYGKGIATLFGPKMQVSEGELAQMKADWLPRLAAREYVEDERWEGIDSNAEFDFPNW